MLIGKKPARNARAEHAGPKPKQPPEGDYSLPVGGSAECRGMANMASIAAPLPLCEIELAAAGALDTLRVDSGTQDDTFEWDDAKAASNLPKHKVSFELARRAFADVFAIEREDAGGLRRGSL